MEINIQITDENRYIEHTFTLVSSNGSIDNRETTKIDLKFQDSLISHLPMIRKEIERILDVLTMKAIT